MSLKIRRRLALAVTAIGLGGCHPQSPDENIIVIPCGFLFACLPSDGRTSAWVPEDRHGDHREPSARPARPSSEDTARPSRPGQSTPGTPAPP